MMDMAINGGKFVITDNNETLVSRNIADEIEDNAEESDNGRKKPEMTVEG